MPWCGPKEELRRFSVFRCFTLQKQEGAKVQIVGFKKCLFVLFVWFFLEKCTFAPLPLAKGKCCPFLFQKIDLHPLARLWMLRACLWHPNYEFRNAHQFALHIWQKWDSWTSCVCLFEHLSTSTHLTKVGLLDFSRSSVCRSGRRLHIWQGWDPSTCLIRCSTHMWAPLNLTKMRLLDFRTLSAYTFAHVITCRQNETPRLPQFVCAHIF